MARAACPARRLLETSLRGKARSMLFSNRVVDEFCEEATLPEMRAGEGLLARQMEVRAANQLERRMRRARFPAAKSLDGYDFSQVSFPDGYGEADPDTVLLVPYPYDEDIYNYFLQSQIDKENGEMAKYNQSVVLYNNAYQTFWNWYNRTHVPLPAEAAFRF